MLGILSWMRSSRGSTPVHAICCWVLDRDVPVKQWMKIEDILHRGTLYRNFWPFSLMKDKSGARIMNDANVARVMKGYNDKYKSNATNGDGDI